MTKVWLQKRQLPLAPAIHRPWGGADGGRVVDAVVFCGVAWV